MKTVYLAGPITGCSYAGCTDWRTFAAKELLKSGILGLSPMRAKAFLSSEKQLKDTYNCPIACEKGITIRDRLDVCNCDLVLANFLKTDRVSIGAAIEFGWADAFRVPIIWIVENEGNIHDHGMMREIAGFRANTLEKGLDIAKSILYVPSPEEQHQEY